MFKTIAFVVALAAAPGLAFAHGPTPAAQHGGQVEEAGENWVELVVKNTQVIAYVNDDQHKPVASARLGGKATVLAGGKKQDATLVASDGNSLTGTLVTPVSGKATAVISLRLDGKPAQVRFNITAP